MEIDRPITIAITLFIILVVLFYLVLPKYQEFRGLLVKLGEKEAEFKGKDAYFVEVTKTYKELMLYQDNLEKIETALPSKFVIAPLVNLLQKKANENGLILLRTNLSKSSSVGGGTGIKESYFSANLSGSYSAFKNFLSSLEKSARLIEVENISFAVQLPTPDNPKPQESFSYQLTIKVYSY